MFSIRTALVVAAFVAMGLTSAAEYLARTAFADPEPFVTVGAEQVLPGKAFEWTRKAPVGRGELDISPWI